MREDQAHSFDDIAVALSQAASIIRSQIDQMKYTAAAIGLSEMGEAVSIAELERITTLTAVAHLFFKDGAPAEREIRAAVDRKKRGRWSLSFGRVAAI